MEKIPDEKSLYELIAYREGSLFSIWGPCSDGTVSRCECEQCLHANADRKERSRLRRRISERAIHLKPIPL